MIINRIKVLTLNNEASNQRLGECLTAIARSDAHHLPVDICYGLDGASEEIPLTLLGGRWDDDLIHFNGSKAVCHSHLNIILGAHSQCKYDDECVMVLEDDVIINPYIMTYLNYLKMPDDWDFLHLSYWDPRCGIEHQEEFSRHVSRIINLDCCTGMFSYLVRPRAAYKRLLDAMPFTCEIDNFLLQSKKFNILVVDHVPWLTDHVAEESVRNQIDKSCYEAAKT